VLRRLADEEYQPEPAAVRACESPAATRKRRCDGDLRMKNSNIIGLRLVAIQIGLNHVELAQIGQYWLIARSTAITVKRGYAPSRTSPKTAPVQSGTASGGVRYSRERWCNSWGSRLYWEVGYIARANLPLPAASFSVWRGFGRNKVTALEREVNFRAGRLCWRAAPSGLSNSWQHKSLVYRGGKKLASGSGAVSLSRGIAILGATRLLGP